MYRLYICWIGVRLTLWGVGVVVVGGGRGWILLLHKKIDVMFLQDSAPETMPATFFLNSLWPGGRFDIKMPSYQYRDSNVKDKKVSQLFYL